MGYNPSLSNFINNAQNRWGNPEDNTAGLIRYWIGDEFDGAVYGLRMNSGEVNAIQAPKKQRKSTLIANLALNFARQLPAGQAIAIDTLESGMTPEVYADTFVSIMGTKIIVGSKWGTDRAKWPSAKEIVEDKEIGPQLRLNPDFFMFSKRITELQHKAIEGAKLTLARLPISIFGASPLTGGTRNMEDAIKRWDALYKGEYPEAEGVEHRIFVVDNLQQYKEFAGNSYHGLEVITNAFSTFIVNHPGSVGFLVSQVSLTSVRLSQSLETEMEARGGSRLAEECNYVFQTQYDKDKAPLHMIISTPYSRRTPPPTMKQELEPYSGAFLRLATPVFSHD